MSSRRQRLDEGKKTFFRGEKFCETGVEMLDKGKRVVYNASIYSYALG